MENSITKDKRAKKKKIVQTIASVAFWIAVWQIASVLIGQELFLVSPLVVLQTLFSFLGETVFWHTVGFSFARIVLGFLCAILLGVVLAILSSRISWVRILLYPLTTIINSTPIVSFIILALIWISSKNLSMFISFLMVLPILYTNTLQGILNVDQKLLEMAQVFRLRSVKKLLYIYLPDVMPFFISACSVSLGMCWKSGIAAEVIGLPTGSIGEKLYQAKIYLNTGDLFAWTVVIILLSLLFEKVFLYLLLKMQHKIERNSAK